MFNSLVTTVVSQHASHSMSKDEDPAENRRSSVNRDSNNTLLGRAEFGEFSVELSRMLAGTDQLRADHATQQHALATAQAQAQQAQDESDKLRDAMQQARSAAEHAHRDATREKLGMQEQIDSLTLALSEMQAKHKSLHHALEKATAEPQKSVGASAGITGHDIGSSPGSSNSSNGGPHGSSQPALTKATLDQVDAARQRVDKVAVKCARLQHDARENHGKMEQLVDLVEMLRSKLETTTQDLLKQRKREKEAKALLLSKEEQVHGMQRLWASQREVVEVRRAKEVTNAQLLAKNNRAVESQLQQLQLCLEVVQTPKTANNDDNDDGKEGKAFASASARGHTHVKKSKSGKQECVNVIAMDNSIIDKISSNSDSDSDSGENKRNNGNKHDADDDADDDEDLVPKPPGGMQ